VKRLLSRLPLAAIVLSTTAAIAIPPQNYDAFSASAPAGIDLSGKLSAAPDMVKPGSRLHVEPRLGVPTFLWAGAGSATPATLSSTTAFAAGLAPTVPDADAVARMHLNNYGPLYGLDDLAMSTVVLREIHDTGRGGIIARYRQEIDGIEVFRDSMSVLMDRDLSLIGISGYLAPSAGTLLKTGAPAFTIGATDAIASAVRDFTGAAVSPQAFRPTGEIRANYAYFGLDAAVARTAGLVPTEGTRAKQVYFHLPEGLVPAYYLELDGLDTAGAKTMFSYVISADDGRVLFRNNLTAQATANPYSYRVWAEASGQFRPFDGPQGTDSSPHNLIDGFQAPYVPQNLVTLSSGPISTQDPWLPIGASDTTGNNVEAYADLFSPDGFSAGDFHAGVSSPGVFDWQADMTLPPNFVAATGSRQQQMASIVQLFYNINFFHDWYYDSGFNEISGNGQKDNYGRGGVDGDSLRGEAQDSSGRNNANMTTPADGGRPRMQMFLFDGLADNGVSVTATPDPTTLPAKTYAPVGTAVFGPANFVTSGPIVWATGAGGSHDGCDGTNANAPIPNVAGKIAFIDRGGSCGGGFAQKYQNAVLGGAIGVIIGNIASSASPGTAPGMAGAPVGAQTIGILSLNFANSQRFRAAFPVGTVQGSINRPVAGIDRDGSIDAQIQAHEWGHYISNRLVGNANGLTSNLSRGLGEGWADFHAVLLTVRAEDIQVPGNDRFQGAYALGGYATVAFSAPSNPYYFGIRRFPYSTDLTKNPLTYRNIADGQPLANTAPLNVVIDDGSGTNNAEVHNTGEIWAAMLWECYASLLNDGGLTFDAAQKRMKDILVAAYKMTPSDPTLLEARDAVLAAAYSFDPLDYTLFNGAFAKRGAGGSAQSPDRYSLTNVGVVEDFTPGIGATLVATPSLIDDVSSPCPDGVLQVGETGTLTVTLANALPDTLPQITGTLSVAGTTSPGLTINNPTLVFPPATAFGTTQATTTVSLDKTATGTRFDFRLALANALSTLDQTGQPIPVVVNLSIRANYNFGTSATDDVESPRTAWFIPLSTTQPTWKRVEVGPAAHRWRGPDDGRATDISLTSPPMQVGAGPLTISISHRWQFEFSTTGPTFFDGGVAEISTDNGLTWTDIGAKANTLGLGGYFASTSFNSGSVVLNPLLPTNGGNPLGGRPAFGGLSPLFPTMLTTNFNLGTAFANQAIRVRFRIGSDDGGAGGGWEIDNIAFNGVLNQPFDVLVPSTGACAPVVARPNALAGPNLSVASGAANVTLDGSGSTTPNAAPLSFLWVQLDGPSVALNTPTSTKPTFTAPVLTPVSTTAATVATLLFQLTVSDGVATSLPSLVTVTVTNPDRVPVARAGNAQSVVARTTVTLDGSGSTDADGNPLTYAWTQTAGPAVVLSSATAQKPTFVAPDVVTPTTLTFSLVVNDGHVNSAASTVNVTVVHANHAPIALAVAPATALERTTVTLDGTGSTDADGDALSFFWFQTGGPPVGISFANTAQAQFLAPTVTATATFTFQLVVTDPFGATATATVSVSVSHVNRPPTASAGPNQTVNEKTVVQLHGIGTDPDGDAITYSWTQLSPAKPAVVLSNAADAEPFFFAPEVEGNKPITFVFQLAVSDGNATTTSTVTVVVQKARGHLGLSSLFAQGGGGCSTGGAGSIAPLLGLLGFLLLRRRRSA